MKSTLWDAIIEISPVQFGVYDLLKESMIFSSGLAEKILGFTTEELKVKSKDHYVSLIHPDDYAILEENLEKLKNDGGSDIYETVFRIQDKEGHFIWVASRSMVYERNAEGRVTKIVSATQDVTHIKVLEAELNERVRQLEDISSKNAHELRAPVATILGLVQMIETKYFISNYFDKKLIDGLKRSVTKLDKVVYEITRMAEK